MSSNFQVTLDKERNRVLKSGPTQILELEALMTHKAYEVSQKHANFRVPKVFSFNASLGILEMEYIPDISPLRFMLYEKASLTDFLQKTAQAIFIIHENVCLENEEIVFLPNDFMDDACLNTAIHGDFTLDNVQYDVNNGTIVLIDWSFCPKFHIPANYGSRFFDLAFMVNSIFSSPPYSFIFCQKERFSPALKFIDSYFKLTNSSCDYHEFKKYLQKFSRFLYKQSKNGTKITKIIKERNNRLSFIKFADFL